MTLCDKYDDIALCVNASKIKFLVTSPVLFRFHDPVTMEVVSTVHECRYVHVTWKCKAAEDRRERGGEVLPHVPSDLAAKCVSQTHRSKVSGSHVALSTHKVLVVHFTPDTPTCSAASVQ